MKGADSNRSLLPFPLGGISLLWRSSRLSASARVRLPQGEGLGRYGEKIWPEIHGRQPNLDARKCLGEAGGSRLKSVIVAPAAVIPAATARGG